MELRAFKEDDYEFLIRWIATDKLNYLWGGPTFSFPLDHSQIGLHCAQLDVFPFIFVIDGENAGYVELIKTSESHFRICRVFVSREYRGKGQSKLMLSQLIELAKNEYGAKAFSLAVFEQNKVAVNCYRTLGFNVTSCEVGTRSFDGETWNLLCMEKRL